MRCVWTGLAVWLLAAAGAVSTSAAVEIASVDDDQLRVIVFGAHPDDAEIRVGGTAALWAKQGAAVKFVSLTNGDIGHWKMAGGALAQRRTAEVKAAARLLGISSEVLDIHDGELMPTLENRRKLVRLIRQWKADIVIGHRPNDYHPDHRYTGILMQDAAYMVTVPFFCPDVPALDQNPVFLFSSDNFERPNPFRPDVVVAIDAVMDQKVAALAKIESQFIEGGVHGYRRGMPQDDAELKKRHEGLRNAFRARFKRVADKYRDQLIELYGTEKGKQVAYAEAFEVCEYGRRPSPGALRELFPLKAGLAPEEE